MMRRFSWLTAVLTVAVAVPAAADTIRLRSGKAITGQFIGGDSKSVRVLLDNGQVSEVLLEQLAAVEFTPRKPPPPPPPPWPGAPVVPSPPLPPESPANDSISGELDAGPASPAAPLSPFLPIVPSVQPLPVSALPPLPWLASGGWHPLPLRRSGL